MDDRTSPATPYLSGFTSNQIIPVEQDNEGHVIYVEDFEEGLWPAPYFRKAIFVPGRGFPTTGSIFNLTSISNAIKKFFPSAEEEVTLFRYSLEEQQYLDFSEGRPLKHTMTAKNVINYFQTRPEERTLLLNVFFPVPLSNKEIQVPKYIKFGSGTTLTGNSYETAMSTSNSLRIIELGSQGHFKESVMAFRGNAHWILVGKGKLDLYLAKPNPKNRAIFLDFIEQNLKQNKQDRKSKLAPCDKYCHISLNQGDSIFIPPAFLVGYFFSEDTMLFRSLFYPIMCPEDVSLGVRFPDSMMDIAPTVKPTIQQLATYLEKLDRHLPLVVSKLKVLSSFNGWMQHLTGIVENVSEKLDHPEIDCIPWINSTNILDTDARDKQYFKRVCANLRLKIEELKSLYAEPLYSDVFYWVSKLQAYVNRDEAADMEIRIAEFIPELKVICFNAIWPNLHDRTLSQLDVDRAFPGHTLKTLPPPPSRLMNSYQNITVHLSQITGRPFVVALKKIQANQPIAILAGVWFKDYEHEKLELDQSSLQGRRHKALCLRYPDMKLVYDTRLASNWANLLKESSEPNCAVELIELDGYITPCLYSIMKIISGHELTVPIGNQLRSLDYPAETDLTVSAQRNTRIYPSLGKPAPDINIVIQNYDDPGYKTWVQPELGSIEVEPEALKVDYPPTPSPQAPIEFDEFGNEIATGDLLAPQLGPIAGPSSRLHRPSLSEPLPSNYSSIAAAGRGEGRGIPRTVPVPGYQGQRGAALQPSMDEQMRVPGTVTIASRRGSSRGRARQSLHREQLICRPILADQQSDETLQVEDEQATSVSVVGLPLYRYEHNTVHSETHHHRVPSGAGRSNASGSSSGSSQEQASSSALNQPEELTHQSQAAIGCIGPWISERDPDYQSLNSNFNYLVPRQGHIWAPDGTEIRVEGIRTIEPNDSDEPDAIPGQYPIISLDDLNDHCEIPVSQVRNQDRTYKCGLETCRRNPGHQVAKHTKKRYGSKKERHYSQLAYGHNLIYHQDKESSLKYRCIYCRKYKYRSEKAKAEHEAKCLKNPENEGENETESDEDEDNGDEDGPGPSTRGRGYGRHEDDDQGPSGAGASVGPTTRSRAQATTQGF